MHSVMRGRRAVGALGIVALSVAFGLAVAAAGRAPAAQAQSLQTGGERVYFVSVVDKDGAPVGSLQPADFVIREDGVAREVLRAEKATGPITFALLADTSQSASPYIPDMRRALTAFIERLGGRNPMSIVGFGERPTVLVDYTLDVPSLQRGAARVFATSGSGAYALQAVEDTTKSLAKRHFERAEILLITGGGPEFSERAFEELIPKLRASGARLDVMSFDIRPPNMSDFGQRNREQFIDAATRATGGNRFSLLDSMALDGALAKLTEELANQYRVTYFHPERLIPPQKVEVTVRQAGSTARATPAKVIQG
jgi:Ca-activated chloride channel homolog